jgi:hypothetical protein
MEGSGCGVIAITVYVLVWKDSRELLVRAAFDLAKIWVLNLPNDK